MTPSLEGSAMLKFAANLTFLFPELDFLDRFEAAARAGFRGVECLFPYGYDKNALIDRLRIHGLEQVLQDLPAGDWAAGERGIACHPDRVGEFQDGVGLTIDYAQALGCKQVNCLAGIIHSDPDKAHRTLVDNLKFAARSLASADIRLLIEPLNTYDIPGFFLCRTGQAVGIMNEVESPNLYLQYDVYHMQVMEGDLARTIEKHFGRIAHVQIADNPGRHEPGTGEIHYPFLFRWLEKLGYEGWIGCEYKPRAGTIDGLAWLNAFFEH
jgi:hydroxypyruvate isomerase